MFFGSFVDVYCPLIINKYNTWVAFDLCFRSSLYRHKKRNRYVPNPNANKNQSSTSSSNSEIDYEQQYIAAKNQQATYDMVDNTLSAFDCNILGYEKRNSLGWQTNSCFIQTSVFRLGFSSYETNTSGDGGMFYAFSTKTKDVMSSSGITQSAGIGVDLLGVFGAELYGEGLGLGAQLSIGDWSLSASINLTGATSITFAKDEMLESGNTLTKGFTIGLNTFLLGVAVATAYGFVTTGNTSGIEQITEILRRT